MTDQFAALAAIAQNPGKTCDEVLADFYTKWQDEFLVSLLLRAIHFTCFVVPCFTEDKYIWKTMTSMRLLYHWKPFRGTEH
jgi:GH25 family lysozyme M1 (1,4-beta-N-acetylmuramidase)